MFSTNRRHRRRHTGARRGGWQHNQRGATVKKSWQRFLVFGVTLTLLASSALVRPLAAADDSALEAKLKRDYIAASEIIRSNYIEPVEYDLLTKAAIQGMLRTLDPHSNFYDRKSFDEMRSEQRSQYYGIGATIGPRNRGVYILEPLKGAPAARAGLRYGDQIIGIDGKNTEQWTSDQVKNSLRGEQGTRVNILVRRIGAAEPVKVTIEREAVEYPSISAYYMVRPGVGYINLQRGFHSTTSDELTAAIAALKAQGMTSLVLDVRGNPGGFLDQAIKVADKFLQRGQIVLSIRGREGRYPDRYLPAESGAPETFPLVILINGGTASASEIVAGAVQDHDRGLVVGESSFGKGLVQTIFPLPGGAGLTLTTARYYTPSGRLIQRDYSNGSFYEYIFRRSAQGEAAPATKPRSEQRKTDLGREVFGGGGIEPDIKVENVGLTRTQLVMANTGLFMFVRELVGGQIAAAPQFKLNGIDFERQPKSNEFLITDELLKVYQDFMHKFVREHPDLNLTPAMVDDNLVWARKQIREEVLVAAYGFGKSQQGMADLDLQLQRAITELPNAAELAERARRNRRTSRN
jgi:carboxyl-terminal processing protease